MRNILNILILVLVTASLPGQNPFKANILFNQNKYEEAIKEYHLLIQQIKSSNGNYDTTYLVGYYDHIAECFKEINIIDSIIYYEGKIFEIALYHNLFGIDYYQYKALLYSNNLSLLGKTDVAERLISEIYTNYYNVIPDSVKILYLSFKRDFLEILGKTEQLNNLLKEKEDIIRRNIYSNWLNFENEIFNLGTNYYFIDNIEKTESLYKEAIVIAQKKYGQNDYRVGTFYLTTVNFYLNIGLLGEAEEFLELLRKCVSSEDKNSSLFFDYLGAMGRYNEIKGDFNLSLKFYLDYLEFKQKSNENSNLSTINNNIGLLYMKLNDLKRAEYYFLQSVGGENHKMEKSYGYASFCNNMGMLMFHSGQIQYSKILFNNGLIILEEIGQTKSGLNFTLLGNLALVYIKQDSLEIAYNLLKYHISKIDTTDGRFIDLYSKAMFNLSTIAYHMNLYQTSLDLVEEFNKLQVRIYGNSYADLGVFQLESAIRYELLGDFIKSDSLFYLGLSTLKKEYASSKLYLSEDNLQQFTSNKNQYFSVIKSYFQRRPNIIRFVDEAYNCELFQKHFLLSSSLQMRKNLLNDCSDDCLIIFNKWQENKVYLAKEYSKPPKLRSDKIQEREFEKNDLENRLIKLSKTFAYSKKSGSLTYKDIQNKINSNQIVIEFSAFLYRNPKTWTDSTVYIALILRQDDTIPTMVSLFEQKQLDSFFVRTTHKESSHINKIYKNRGLYELIWKPLEKYVKHGDQIYFSPSGSMHSISLGAIADSDSTHLSDHYTFHQVGSTGVLSIEDINNKPVKDVAIFGGIDFDASIEQIAIAAKDIVREEDIVSRSLYTQNSTRSGKWTHLNGTLDEVQSIDKMAKSMNIQSKLFTGSQATEERFKSLTGEKSPSMIHIATHGFFFPDPKVDKKKLEMISFQHENTFTLADNPMNRSGLLMAGGNKAWIGEELTTNHEDGILTAYEVSNMSLFNTELVVLSACETGLGDIKGSEGVYGLQRAIKQAGVRYLMMSLWKVPDLTTKEFMTTFYTEYLINQKPVREAFNTTQTKMKNKYRNEPYKWGGFVLME